MSTNGNGKIARRFGKRLRKARTLAGLSQAGLMDLTGIDPASLSSMENGHKLPSFNTLRTLCMALHVEGDYLLLRRGR